MRLGFFDPATRLSVTDSPVTFDVPGQPESRHCYVVTVDIAVHVSRNEDATADDLRLAADSLVTVNAFGGESISFVKAEGASDGNVFIARTDHD